MPRPRQGGSIAPVQPMALQVPKSTTRSKHSITPLMSEAYRATSVWVFMPPLYPNHAHVETHQAVALHQLGFGQRVAALNAEILDAVHQQQFYVSISRGRERRQVFTDDAGRLRSPVTHSSERLAAVEVVVENPTAP